MAGSRRLTALSADVLSRIHPCVPDGPLVVALSGGADSAVCAWAAAATGRPVRAIHVHHGFPASPHLEKAARAVAEELGIPLTVEQVTVPVGASPEGQARTVRYRVLESTPGTHESLLTGHTADDQAETVLGNLLRGSGAEGLAGIPRRRGRIVRPLLDVYRAETRELATLLGLPWVDDPANVDPAFRRTALRREIIPQLEATINPALRRSLVRTAAILAQEHAELDSAARVVVVEETATGVRVPAPLLVVLPPAVAARAVRRALRLVLGAYAGSAAEAARVVAVAGGGPAAELSGGVRVERRGVWLTLDRAEQQAPPAPVEWPLPGRAEYGAWLLEGWIEHAAPPAFPLSPWVEVFDADHVTGPAVVRAAHPGDRVAISGGHKPLGDVLAEGGVPKAERAVRPVVEASGSVIWVPGVRRAAAGWVSGTTRRYLWVRAAMEEDS